MHNHNKPHSSPSETSKWDVLTSDNCAQSGEQANFLPDGGLNPELFSVERQ